MPPSLNCRVPRTLRLLKWQEKISAPDAGLIVGRGHAKCALDTIAAGGDGARVVVHMDNNLAGGLSKLTPEETFAGLLHL